MLPPTLELLRDILREAEFLESANAELRPLVEEASREGGFTPPILCTPDELMGG